MSAGRSRGEDGRRQQVTEKKGEEGVTTGEGRAPEMMTVCVPVLSTAPWRPLEGQEGPAAPPCVGVSLGQGWS